MTTKELEKKLKISENTCIHCPTLELAKQVLNIFHQLGLRWCDETHYTLTHNWDWYEENTVYYPFDGKLTSLKLVQEIDKVIYAEEFIALHTEKEKFNLENYIPKGGLEGFPKEIIARMLECQEEQCNPRDVSVFEKRVNAKQCIKGFDWGNTQEDWDFWHEVITNKNFNPFFKKYSKQDHLDNCLDFRINDKVYDILLKEVGIVQDIEYSSSIPYGLSVEFKVEFKSGLKSYTINGHYIPKYKNPQLLHYRDDYDYSIIDFNNLPKRQNSKRWRAEKEGEYYFIRFYVEDWFYTSATKENNWYYDSINYNSGNYFQTKEEAQEVADKLNKYFKELIEDKINGKDNYNNRTSYGK